MSFRLNSLYARCAAAGIINLDISLRVVLSSEVSEAVQLISNLWANTKSIRDSLQVGFAAYAQPPALVIFSSTFYKYLAVYSLF